MRFRFAIPVAIGLSNLFVSANAVEVPQQKPGMWETHIQHAGNRSSDKTGVAQNCLDAAALAEGKKSGEDYAKKNCSKNDTRQEGGKWVSDMVCKVGDRTMTTRSVTQFNGEDAYHTEMTVTYDPPEAGRTSTTTTVDGKWLGACKPAG
jgi:hypothetical protein